LAVEAFGRPDPNERDRLAQYPYNSPVCLSDLIESNSPIILQPPPIRPSHPFDHTRTVARRDRPRSCRPDPASRPSLTACRPAETSRRFPGDGDGDGGDDDDDYILVRLKTVELLAMHSKIQMNNQRETDRVS